MAIDRSARNLAAEGRLEEFCNRMEIINELLAHQEKSTLTDRDLFTGDLWSVAGSTGPTLSGLFEAGLPLGEVERRHILRTLH